MFKGCFTAIVTPFNNDSVDFIALEKILDKQIQGDISGIVVCGTTGEAATMNEEERLEVIRFVREKVKDRPVIAGTGSNNTNEVLRFSKKVEALGVDALLIVTPYYNKPNQKGLFEHYSYLEKNLDTPIILYNVPSRTGTSLSLETITRLSSLENIKGIKQAEVDFSKNIELCLLSCEDFCVLSGDDITAMALTECGGDGVVSVVSNIIPQQLTNMIKYSLEGNSEKAKEILHTYQRLIDMMFIEVNPQPVKTLSAVLNGYEAVFRLPLTNMEEKNKEKLFGHASSLGLI